MAIFPGSTAPGGRREPAPDARSCTVQKPHYIIRSVVATGGVYKGQGRNQRKLLTRAYWEFLVHGAQLQAPIPTTKGRKAKRRFSGCPALSGRERADERACPPLQRERVASFSVARVRPRASKGITDLLLLRLRAASRPPPVPLRSSDRRCNKHRVAT